jgi:cation:H+ antiporter
MSAIAELPFTAIIGLFAVCVVAIAVAGVRMVRLAESLARDSGLGQAVVGGALLGGTTSLSGIVVSVSAAHAGYGELAVSNALGGIAVQTAFLVVADIAYRRANLEHAAASLANVSQGVLLMALLTVPLIAASAPPVTVWSVHPATPVLFAGYALGVRLTHGIRRAPMWQPLRTSDTRTDPSERHAHPRLPTVTTALAFAGLAAVVALAGYGVAASGLAISRQTGLSQTVVGALLTATATSLPELVTAVAAVRQGALTLAVAGIIGGNSFDVLLVAMSDLAYGPGSIYHAMSGRETFIIALTLLMTAVLLLGLVKRERHGIANIGFESLLVLAIYLLGMVVQVNLG